MKISELTQISAIRRDIRIPLSIAGQNMSITLGQIIDAISQDVVPFSRIAAQNGITQYVAGSPSANIGVVVFDKATNKFYKAIGSSATSAGQLIKKWTYYSNWDTHDSFYDEQNNIRTDCLFIDTDGKLYRYNGTTLIRAGLTEDEANQIRLSTAIQVADEEEMERRIAAGEFEAGQLYFTAEEE